MNKDIDIEEKVKSLTAGQVFFTFAELSDYFNIHSKNGDPPKGNSRKRFLDELNRFVEYKKDGYKFIIVKVRSENEILPPLPDKNNRKLSLQLQNQIAYYLLQKCDQNSWTEFFWTPSAILRACGMTNRQFYQYSDDLNDESMFGSMICGTSFEDTNEDELDNLRKNLVDDAVAFRQNTKSVMVKYIESALQSMANNKEIFFDNLSAVFVNTSPVEYHIPSEDQKAIYLKMYTRVLHRFKTPSGRTCESEQDLYFINKLSEFYEALDNEFREIFTYEFARPMYHITIEPHSLKRSIARTEYKLQRQRYHEVNQYMCKKLPQLSHVRRGHSVLEKNPEYGTIKNEPPFHFANRELSDEILDLFIDGMIRVPENCGIPSAGFKWCNSKYKGEL